MLRIARAAAVALALEHPRGGAAGTPHPVRTAEPVSV